jgi:predicted transposase YbfD/YdcC
MEPPGKEARMANSIEPFFSDIPDPRSVHGTRHVLSDMVALAVCAVVCGAESWVDVELFGRSKRAWLSTFLDLPHGIPSHDTLGRVFAMIDPEHFERCFRAWTGALAGVIVGVVAIDGKTIRRSFNTADRKAAIHMISAWAADNRVVFGQLAVDAKSNEITAIPRLLRMLDIKGLTVTIDAIGCQKPIAAQIVDQGGDYMLQVKANQPELHEDAKGVFARAAQRGWGARAHDTHEELEKGHGRIERRRTSLTWDVPWLIKASSDWKGLRGLVMVERERTVGDSTTISRHYYITSLHTRKASEAARACRAHWGVENGLHWSLDVGLNEDQCRIRSGNAAENFSRLRRIALNLLKNETTVKAGIKAKSKTAGWNHDYLLKVLGSG